MQSSTAVHDSTVHINSCPTPAIAPLIAPKPSPVPATASPLRSTPPPLSAAVRSSIRRFLAVSNIDQINMLDVYRQLQREYGDEEVNKSKMSIRQCTKAIIDEMATAHAVNGSASPSTAAAHSSGMNGTAVMNGHAPPPLAPIVLPITRTAQRHSAPPALPSVPTPPPIPSASPPSLSPPPPLEAVPPAFAVPPVPSLPDVLLSPTSYSSISPPTLPLANGHTAPHGRRQSRSVSGERRTRHSDGKGVAVVRVESEQKRAEDEDSEDGQEAGSEHDSDDHDSDGDNEAEDEEENERNKQKQRKPARQTKRGRSNKKREANEPLAVDNRTGQETWEVRKIHRSDVDDKGEKVYKVSWYNWTGWPRHTWISRDEWMGSTRELDKFEEAERQALEREQKRAAAGGGGSGHRHPKRRKMSTGKNHKGDITAQTSWEFDEKKLREADEKQWQKQRKEAQQAKEQAKKGKRTTGKARAATGTKQRRNVKKEEEDDEAIDDTEVAVKDELLEDGLDDEERAQRSRAEAQKKREEHRRLQEAEDRRIISHVRADSRYLVPWSSDDEAMEEDSAVKEEVESDVNKRRRVRRERRRLLRLHQLSDLLQRRSHSPARSVSSVKVETDGGESEASSSSSVDEEDRELREEAEVSIHESELTDESSEAEMDRWKAERVYRVEAIVDHRRAGGLSQREQEKSKSREAARKKREDDSAAARKVRRLNAFDRVQQRLEGEATAAEERKEAPTEQKATADEEKKVAADEVTVMTDGGEAANGDSVDGEGRLEYLVHWSGHEEKHRSWEPEAHLSYGCNQLLREYKRVAGLPEYGMATHRTMKKRRRGRRY